MNFKTTIIHALFVASYASRPVAGFWATFYSDPDCTKDETTSFSTGDPGCFSVGDREYVKYHGFGSYCFNLVVSPAPNCPCQSSCLPGSNTPEYKNGCPLTNARDTCNKVPKSGSLRYISAVGCDQDNCPTTNIGERDERNSTHSFLETPESNYQTPSEPSTYSSEQQPESYTRPESQTYASNRLERPAPAPEHRLRSHEAKERIPMSAPTAYNDTEKTLEQRDFGVPGLGYFRLCQDEFCSQGCSINFNFRDPGCIANDKFKSLHQSTYLDDGFGGGRGPKMVGSKGPGCTCQSACGNYYTPGGCTTLDPDMQAADSFRMVGGRESESCEEANKC